MEKITHTTHTGTHTCTHTLILTHAHVHTQTHTTHIHKHAHTETGTHCLDSNLVLIQLCLHIPTYRMVLSLYNNNYTWKCADFFSPAPLPPLPHPMLSNNLQCLNYVRQAMCVSGGGVVVQLWLCVSLFNS